MRRLLFGWAAAGATLACAVAWAGNQDVAEQIAANLRQNGQLNEYRISVKFQDGTVWLQGRVNDAEQMNRAVTAVLKTPGVTRVVNDLTLVGDQTAASGAKTGKAAPSGLGKLSALNPLRGSSGAEDTANSGRAQRLASSFSNVPAQRAYARTATSGGAVPVSMMQAVPPPKAPQPIPPGAEPVAPIAPDGAAGPAPGMQGPPMPMYSNAVGGAPAPTRYDQPYMPNYAWPSYASYPNYAAVTYPKQYSPTAWPYIGPFYPYPQVPLGWRKVTLEWDNGWWFLDFKDDPCCTWWR